MFDMSWGEIMLIGGVALVVIGPKDLPRALRTVGQVTGKLKRMAGEFQVQFNEAMREADLDDARREVEGLNRSVSTFNPVQTIRDEIKGAVDAAGTRPAPGALAAATAQLQADQAQAEAAAAAPEAETAASPPVPEAPPLPPVPQPSIDGAPLIAPEAAAGLEAEAAPLPPEAVPPAAPAHAEAKP